MIILTFLIVIETVDMADGKIELLRRKGVFSSSFSWEPDGSIVNTGRSFEPQVPYIMKPAPTNYAAIIIKKLEILNLTKKFSVKNKHYNKFTLSLYPIIFRYSLLYHRIFYGIFKMCVNITIDLRIQ